MWRFCCEQRRTSSPSAQYHNGFPARSFRQHGNRSNDPDSPYRRQFDSPPYRHPESRQRNPAGVAPNASIRTLMVVPSAKHRQPHITSALQKPSPRPLHYCLSASTTAPRTPCKGRRSDGTYHFQRLRCRSAIGVPTSDCSYGPCVIVEVTRPEFVSMASTAR